MHKSSRIRLELHPPSGLDRGGKTPLSLSVVGGCYYYLNQIPDSSRGISHFSESSSLLGARSRANHHNSQNSCRVSGSQVFCALAFTALFPIHAPSCAAASESMRRYQF